MKVSLSKEKQGIMAIAGHVGCGHCHSHKQYVQDDSGGLATVLTLFQEATGLSLTIKDIKVQIGKDGFFEVETESGGKGKAFARRGITLQEAKLAKSLLGRDPIRTQTLVQEAFGRFYGQGIHEAPVALQTAMANAALDSFVKNFPQDFCSGYEDIQETCGYIAGAVLDFEGIPVSVLGTVNASSGGVGPVEDLEGNCPVGHKGQIMESLGMMDLPTIIVEGKIYSPLYSDVLENGVFLVRADKESDNPYVAYSMMAAGEKLKYPIILREDVMARVPGVMAKLTEELGEKIVTLGNQLKVSQYAQEKVNILATLATLVSQDGAGISFMTNKLHDIIGGTGIIPRTGAVFNYVVPLSYQKTFLVPFLTEEDVQKFVSLTKETVAELHKELPKAIKHIETNKYPIENLNKLVLKGETQ